MNNELFYTLKGYKLKEKNIITEAMEDYLEMIYRYKDDNITVKDLSIKLNVKPSSVSKMVIRLKNNDLILYEKYGKIKLTDLGCEVGSYLLYRHKILNDFFKYINKDEYELKQVEKIEHFIDEVTIKNISLFLKSIKK